MPQTSERARELAFANAAAAVVWISAREEGYALWVYERQSHRVVAQALPSPPPFDAPTAASVALTLKTLLRHSDVAPSDERFGAPSLEPTGASDEDLPSRIDLEVHAGAGFARTDPSAVEARMGLAVYVWRRALGVRIGLASGPGMTVADASFSGRLVDGALSVLGVLRKRLGSFQIVGAGGAALRLVYLDGVLVVSGASRDVVRLVPSLEAQFGLEWFPTSMVRVGLRGTATWTLRTQRYFVAGNEVLRARSLSGGVGLYLGFAIP